VTNMKKKKLYIYPNAKPHDHDTNESGFANNLYNTVPMSEVGIKKYFTITSPEDAEYFYMGQFSQDKKETLSISSQDYKYFVGNESKHILDIDGEGGFEYSMRPHIPLWLHESIITANGVTKNYSEIKMIFPRPTFSQLLVDIAQKKEEFEFPNNKSLGLRCFLNHKSRALVIYTLHNSNFEKELHVNKKWEGLTPVNTNGVQDAFISTMLGNSISLCPRGSGIDSVRFYESCYYNRVPVIISDHDYYLLGEEFYDTSFCYRICDEGLSPELLHKRLEEITNTPHELLLKRANCAKKYFNEVVVDYFSDPTLFFIKWLNKKNETK
jgi:hypothetical protein